MNDLATLFESVGQKYGLPPGLMSRTAWIESKFKPATNPLSGAAGYFQFMPGTAARYGLQNPYDPAESADAAARNFVNIRNFLQNKLGRDISPAEYYLGHQQGEGGAFKLLSNPSANASQSLGTKHVGWNAGNAQMTNQDFANMWMSKFNGAAIGKSPASAPQTGQTGNTGNSGSAITDAVLAAAYANQQEQTPQVPQMFPGISAGLGSSVAQAFPAATPTKAWEVPKVETTQPGLPASLLSIIRKKALAGGPRIVDQTRRGLLG